MDIKGPVKDATSSAKSRIDSAANDLQNTVDTATKDLAAVTSNVQKAVDKSLSDQPYTTLLMAVAGGFILGAIWKA